MNKRELLSECLTDQDLQFNVIDDAVIKIVSRIYGVRYNTLFKRNGTEKFRKAKRMYFDMMVNHLGYNQTIIAKRHCKGFDASVASALKTLKINYNDEYHEKRNLCIEVINLLKKYPSKN